jgi:hypothetical protein
VNVVAKLVGLGSLWSALFLPLRSPAHAQTVPETAPAPYVITAPEAARSEALQPQVLQWLTAHSESAEPLRLESTLAPIAALVNSAELEKLSRVEGILREARELSARFDERLALSRY